VEEIKGAQGELIDRLIALLNSDALGEGMWYNVGKYAQMFLGGAALNRVDPHTGEEPAPGPKRARRTSSDKEPGCVPFLSECQGLYHLVKRVDPIGSGELRCRTGELSRT